MHSALSLTQRPVVTDDGRLIVALETLVMGFDIQGGAP
jgi:hypothetical protein